MKAHELIAAMNPDSQEYADAVVAAKFDLGELEAAWSMAQVSSQKFYELPAEVCLFQITMEQDTYLLLAKSHEGFSRWGVFTKIASTGGRWQGIDLRVDIDKEGKVAIGDAWGGPDISLDWDDDNLGLPEHRAWALMQVIKVSQAIEVFSCCNIQLVEHQPPRFINQKRIKKGKTPFYAYKTLHISLDDDGVERSQKGARTHASPRLHLRRGHIRRLPGGRRIWVRAHLVGDKSIGVIHKDYDVRQMGA